MSLLRGAARRAFVLSAPVLRRTRLSVPVWRAWERRLARGGRADEPTVDSAGLPVPPVRLRVRVISDPDLDRFLEGGRRTADAITELVESSGRSFADLHRVLDFGCGCGRVLRHWHGQPGLAVHGCDHDKLLTAWIAEQLPWVSVDVNELAPPLPYPDGHFDLVYAVSVFTHLTVELAGAWERELHRVLAPGGLALVTTHGESLVAKLRPAERAAFDAGELVVQFPDAAGSNLCTTFHPEAYMRTRVQGFEAVAVRRPEEHRIFPQDMWLLRRDGAPARVVV